MFRLIRSFGSDALNVCVRHPKSCYVYILELLGKKMDHPQVCPVTRDFPSLAYWGDS